MNFGISTTEERVQDVSSDFFGLIEKYAPEAAATGDIRKLVIGSEVSPDPNDYIGSDEIIDFMDEHLPYDRIVECISERYGEEVWDGMASIDASSRVMFPHGPHSDNTQAIEDVRLWIRAHIELDPPTFYSMKPALPLVYVEGEWTNEQHENDEVAVITYASEPSPETGHVGWCWWAMGKMGDAPTLVEARQKAVAALDQFAAETTPNGAD